MRFFKTYVILFLSLITVLPVAITGCSDGTEPLGSSTVNIGVTPFNSCVEIGGSQTFDVVIHEGFGPFTYEWTFSGGDIATSDLKSPTVSYAAVGDFSAIVKVSAESSGATETVNVHVREDCTGPTATIDAPLTESIFTVGETVSFEGTVSGGEGPYSYTWRFSKAGRSIATSLTEDTTFNFPSVGTWFVDFTARNTSGSSSTASITVDVVQGGVLVEIQSPDDGSSVGTAEDVFFSAVVTGGVLPLVYSWDFGPGSGVLTSTEANPTVQFPNTGTFEVSVNVSDANGKGSGSDSITLTVTDVISVDAPVGSVNVMAQTGATFGGVTYAKGAKVLMGLKGVAVFDIDNHTFGSPIFADTKFFGGTVATPVGGPDVLIYYDFYNAFTSNHNGSSFAAPITLPSSSKTQDVQMMSNDPGAGSFLLTSLSGFAVYNHNPMSDQFELGDEFPTSLFPGISGSPVTAFAREVDAGFLACTSGSQLYFHDGVLDNDATLIGSLGAGPQKIAYLNGVCVVANQIDDTCTVITWDFNDNVVITDSYVTGRNPRGCDLMVLQSGNIACVTANRNDNSITVAEITQAGMVVSSTTFAAAGPCGSPNDAVWLNDGSTDILASCLSESSVVILGSGL